MYCVKCSSEIADGVSFCPKCGEKTNTTNNQGTAVNQIPIINNQKINGKSLEKCAWFAPVSIIVSFLLTSVAESLISVLQSKTGLDAGEYTAAFYFIYAVGALVNFFVALLPCVAFFSIATSRVDKNKSKIAKTSVFFIWFLPSISSIISTLIYYFGYGINLVNKLNLTISPLTIYYIQLGARIILTVFFAIMSYFIIAKYFKSIDNLANKNTDEIFLPKIENMNNNYQ